MIKEKLRRLGLQLSPQRLAILKVLEGNTRHPSAEDIYKQLKPEYPSLSLATVYNTLEVLARAQEIQVIRIKGDKRHFDPNTKPHGHFLCRVCGSIHDLDVVSLPIKTPLNVNGYVVEEYKIYFYGTCPVCREKSAKEG
ncbi:MAG: Fur family transcriptional regulator [Heliobacteriaceae bacterium]|nr:Fur family transcriptional regulator [Heliobacteriaceae bacterium]MDD4588785.1 Fur family transcriptional regulator [Heliobacteriaceae bacterium]